MKSIGIIMNGVTGRMGTRQHLERSIVAIRKQGGLRLLDGEVLMPEPILVGRNAAKLEALAAKYGIERWSTDLDACLSDSAYSIYFDAQTTARRSDAVSQALRAGKHVYCEKPVATSMDEALALARLAAEQGLKNGVVQDKLFLPGFLKLKRLLDSGFFGQILSIRGEFGYWVFEGDNEPLQRPSWNYRKEEGGGIISDMLCHWSYLLENLFGPVRAVSCLGVTHIPTRRDEAGNSYTCTADDAAYATFELEGGIIAHFNSSWCVRVNRDELFEIQVDGTNGSAVAGLRHCKIQQRTATPWATWNPDIEDSNDYRAQWQEVAEVGTSENGFKTQWELFLKHAVLNHSFPYTLLEGAKNVQLAELGMKSTESRAWVQVPDLTVAGGDGR